MCFCSDTTYHEPKAVISMTVFLFMGTASPYRLHPAILFAQIIFLSLLDSLKVIVIHRRLAQKSPLQCVADDEAMYLRLEKTRLPLRCFEYSSSSHVWIWPDKYVFTETSYIKGIKRIKKSASHTLYSTQSKNNLDILFICSRFYICLLMNKTVC